MEGRSAKGCLAAAAIWILILAALAVSYKLLVHPYLTKKLTQETGSPSQYKQDVTVYADSFCGYCVLRSEAMAQELKAKGVRWTVKDDGGDTRRRVKALADGDAQFAAISIDSLLTACAALGSTPASIILLIDESNGGDAVISLADGIPTLSDIAGADARFVITPNSPSEFLARIVIAHFNLPNLSADWMVKAAGAKDVYDRFLAAKPTERKAFVLWEPYVSMAMERKESRTLLDSSKLKGFIVDALVVRRELLRDEPDIVKTVLEAYAKALYANSNAPGGMARLVGADARKSGLGELTDTQAAKVAKGIQWRNLLDNYAAFGLVSKVDSAPEPGVEDVISNIIDVLVRTKAFDSDPFQNKHSSLFFDRPLAALKSEDFHPAKGVPLIPGATATTETTPSTPELARPLSEEQWKTLRPVGELRASPISFTRGSSELSIDGARAVEDLARRMKSFPNLYVVIRGHARPEGDPEANKILAAARASAVAKRVVELEIPAWRVRPTPAEPRESGGEAQSVSFLVGQAPY